MKQILWSLAIAGMWLTSVSMPAHAQALDEGDAPDHGVARISIVNGDVSIRRGDSGELTAAATNGPIVTSDQLLTADGSRAEIQFDSFNMIRLAPSTEVRMGDLQDRRYLVQVAVGTATFRVMRENNAQVEISTPTVSVRPTQPGTFRVTVRPDGSTEITVRQGEAEINSPRGSEVLRAGQTMQARGNASDPEYMIGAAIPQDEWDRWNIQRDQAFQQVTSSRYVSPDIYGTEELDSTGRWENEEPYGNVWVPSVSAGWAPYREGRWVWVDYYGWTWLSEDPFGWAPYHYGSWYSGRYGWAWYPGAVSSRYYWRPALVGFFGWGGGGVNIGFGYGNVGWVPLAPYERYRPWYGSRYGNTNIFNTNIRNDYRNARFNGVTSVRSNDFGRGGRINRNNFVRVSDSDLTRTGSVQGRLPFTASRESRNFSDRQVNAQRLPSVNQNTRFYSRDGGRNGAGGAGRGSTQVGGGGTGRGSTQVGGGQAPGGAQGTVGGQGGARGGQGAVGGSGQTGRGGVANTGGTVGGNGGVNNTGNVGRGGNNAGNNGGNNANSAAPTNGGDRGGAGWRRFDPSAVNAGRGGQSNSGANGRVQTGGQTGAATSNGNGNGGFRGFDSAPQNNGNRGQNTPSVAPSNPAPVQQPRGNGGNGNGNGGNNGWRGFDTAPQNNGNRGQTGPSVAPSNSAPVQQPRGNGNGNGGFRGFDAAPQNNGNRGQQSSPAPAQQQPQRDNSFRGFDRGNSGRAPQAAPSQQQPQRLEPRRQESAPSYSSPQQQAPQQPVRISPSIVRERTQAPPPSYSRPEPQGGGGGGGNARQAAPAAPSGGGGGGGQRGNGGGGGGDRGNGGGGNRGNGGGNGGRNR